MQTLQYARVPVHLQPYLGMIYSGIAEPGPTPLPAMMAQVWICTFPVYWCAPGSMEVHRLPPVSVMGPVLGANTVHVQQSGLIMGLGLWPRGWSELARISAGELCDRAIDATALWPMQCARLLDRIHEANSWPEQAAALTLFVEELVAPARSSRDALLITAIDRWLAHRGTLDSLAHRLGYSHRQVERITTRTHGAGPKLLLARQRTLHAASLLVAAEERQDRVWSEFSDQSHFIREFRRFIGGTPGGFGKQSRIGHSMFSKAWESDPTHPLAYGADRIDGAGSTKQ